MKQEDINHALGELVVMEKYKFVPSGLVGEIVTDFIKIMSPILDNE